MDFTCYMNILHSLFAGQVTFFSFTSNVCDCFSYRFVCCLYRPTALPWKKKVLWKLFNETCVN